MTEQAAKGTTPSIHSYFFFHGEAAAAFTTAVGRRSNTGELRFVTRLKMLRLIPFISSVSPPSFHTKEESKLYFRVFGMWGLKKPR